MPCTHSLESEPENLTVLHIFCSVFLGLVTALNVTWRAGVRGGGKSARARKAREEGKKGTPLTSPLLDFKRLPRTLISML